MGWIIGIIASVFLLRDWKLKFRSRNHNWAFWGQNVGPGWLKNSTKGYFHTSHLTPNPKIKFLKSHSLLTLSKLKDKLIAWWWKKKHAFWEACRDTYFRKQQTLWPIYGWGSTSSGLEPLRRGSFLSLSFQKLLVLVLWTSEGHSSQRVLMPSFFK